MNTMKLGLAIFRCALDVEDSPFVPAVARKPTGVKHTFKLVLSNRDDLNADRQFATDLSRIFALYLKVSTRLVWVGESGKIGAQAGRGNRSEKQQKR